MFFYMILLHTINQNFSIKTFNISGTLVDNKIVGHPDVACRRAPAASLFST